MGTFCTSCGTEVDTNASFCGDCGTQLQSQQEQHVSTDTETGSCEKCKSEIPLDADRCPQCDHEPGNTGILLSILSALSVLWAGLLAVTILISWVVAIGTDFPISDAITVTGGLLLFMSPAIIILAMVMNKERKTPTGRKKSWDEAFDTS